MWSSGATRPANWSGDASLATPNVPQRTMVAIVPPAERRHDRSPIDPDPAPVKITFYNKPNEREGLLQIFKVLPLGGDVSQYFTGTVSDFGPFIVAQDDSAQYGMVAGQHTVTEDDPTGLGYVNIGYALGGDGCPGNPSQETPIDVQVNASSTTQVCIYNIPAGEPSMSKVADGHDGTLAYWDITINNPGVTNLFLIEDEGATVVSINSDGLYECEDSNLNEVGPGDVIDANGVACYVEGGSTFVMRVSRPFGDFDRCEGTEIENTAIVTLLRGELLVTEQTALVQNLEVGQQIPGQTTDSVVIDGDPRYCDSTVTVTKRFDTDDGGTINAGDLFISGWGITLVCDGVQQEGVTGGGGTIAFTVPGPGDGPDTVCTVTEDTVTGVGTVGSSLNSADHDSPVPGTSRGFTLAGDDTADVVFLNDPGDDPTPTPTPPDSTPPTGDTPTPTNTPEPEPTEPIVEETPTEEPSPEPTDSAVESTPVAPDSGQGFTSGSNDTMSLMFVMLALMAFSGALGALSLARGRNNS